MLQQQIACRDTSARERIVHGEKNEFQIAGRDMDKRKNKMNFSICFFRPIAQGMAAEYFI
jgi:hypothetical protein